MTSWIHSLNQGLFNKDDVFTNTTLVFKFNIDNYLVGELRNYIAHQCTMNVGQIKCGGFYKIRPP